MTFHPPPLRVFGVAYSVDCFPFHVHIDGFHVTLQGRLTCNAQTLYELDKEVYKEARNIAMAQAMRNITADRQNRLSIDARQHA